MTPPDDPPGDAPPPSGDPPAPPGDAPPPDRPPSPADEPDPLEGADRLEAELTDDDRALLDSLADGIARRRLTPAALFFLESIKPLGFLGSQVMVFFRPMVAIIWSDPARWDHVQRLLEKRGSIELLLRRLEARS